MTVQYDALSGTPKARELAEFKQTAPAVAGGFSYLQYIFSLMLGGGIGIYLGLIFSHVALLIIFSVIGILAAWGVARYIETNRLKKRFKLYRFATANGFEYTPKIAIDNESLWSLNRSQDVPVLLHQNGMIFTSGGHSKKMEDRLVKPNVFEMANYYYVTGHGKNQQSHDWGYIRVSLRRKLPHIVLDAKKNNAGIFGISLSNLPQTFNSDQTLSLEGDFDKYFTLYAPKQYERDALYIFTPDLMALLIDQSAQFDVEIIDDALYVYSSVPFQMQDPAVMKRILSIVDAVGTKMTKATARYADERVANAREVNQVASEGARLKIGFPLVWSIAIIIFVVWNLIVLFR